MMKHGMIRKEAIERLREKMKTGDTVVYEKLTKADDERFLAHIPVRAQITAKYPFQVSVVCEGDRPCPIRTMTYWEILAGNLWKPRE